jgi:hypothetical protein
MSEVQAPVITEREITIYATRGGQTTKIMTDVKTWGELQPLVRRAGFDLSSLLAAENVNKTDLVNDLAVLPETNFRLFLRPKQTKSGAPDRKECFTIIKAHLVAFPDDKSKFTINGRNMTQLTTPVLQDLVAKYCSVTTTSTTSEEVKEVKYTLENPTNTDLTDIERVEEALSLISPLKSYDSYYKVLRHLGKLRFEISPESNESEEEELAREAREMGY